MFGEGISKIGEIIDLGVDYGVIKKSRIVVLLRRPKRSARDATRSRSCCKTTTELRNEIEANVREAMKHQKGVSIWGILPRMTAAYKGKMGLISCSSCTKICKNDEDWNFIKRAFFLAKEAHEGVRRRSGEPYLLHPIAVAKIVIEEIGLGVKSVVAALLHDVVEDTEYTVEDMERIFGPENRLDG